MKIKNQKNMMNEIFGYEMETDEPFRTPEWVKKPKPVYANIDTKRALTERGVMVDMDSRVMLIYTNNKVHENPFLILQTLGFVFNNEFTDRGNIIFKSEAGVRYAFAGVDDNNGKMTIKMRNVLQTEANKKQKEQKKGDK